MTTFFQSIKNMTLLLSKRPWALALVILAIIFASWVMLSNSLSFLSSPSASLTKMAPKPSMTVTLGALKPQVWPETIEAAGTIAAWQETIIGSQIGGLLLNDVRVNVGDRVRKGQVLATFDSVAPRAEVARLSAALDQANAVAAQANANRVRAESLSGSGAISAQDMLRYATEADMALADAKAARAALDTQQEQLRYVVVVAPEDGIIVARLASPGGVGGVGQELFRMIPHGRLEWRGELTAAQLSKIKPQQFVELTLPDGSLAHARIRQTAPALDQQTRLGLIYADLVNKGSAIAGMYAKGLILLPDVPALTAPATSVVLRDGHHYLFTASPQDGNFVVKAREVTIGRRQGSEIEILSGIADHERIVISGAGFLKDGDLVKQALPLMNKHILSAKPTK